jgi:hypothetical protein
MSARTDHRTRGSVQSQGVPEVLRRPRAKFDLTPAFCYQLFVMLLRRLVVPIIVITLIALRALAYASPPDPSWTDGIWDDNDFDDVVNLITHSSSTSDPHLPVTPTPGTAIISLLPAIDDKATPAPTTSVLHSRAPPSR